MSILVYETAEVVQMKRGGTVLELVVVQPGILYRMQS
jgi:hypothetical protein